jgi:hypothetical protein
MAKEMVAKSKEAWAVVKRLLNRYRIHKAQMALNKSALELARFWIERKATPPEALDALTRDVKALQKAFGKTLEARYQGNSAGMRAQ